MEKIKNHEEEIIKTVIYSRKADHCDRTNCSNYSSISSGVNKNLIQKLDVPSIIEVHFGSIKKGTFVCDQYCEHKIYNNHTSLLCHTSFDLLKVIKESNYELSSSK